MKKIFILLAIGLGLIFSKANAQSARPVTFAPATDTLKNADTAIHFIPVTAGYALISIQPTLTKQSGTVAGTVKLYGTIDGINYQQLNSTTDTIALANQTTNFKVFNYSPVFTKYKIVYITTGTQQSLAQTWYLLRPYTTKTVY